MQVIFNWLFCFVYPIGMKVFFGFEWGVISALCVGIFALIRIGDKLHDKNIINNRFEGI